MVIAVCGAIVLAPMTVGAATGPSVHVGDPSNSSAVARVNKAGGLAVTPRDPSSGSQARVDKGALRVGGTIKVANFPATQAVTGTVSVGNLPSTQPVTGTVNVGNLPTTQQISGTVSAKNLGPADPYSATCGGQASLCDIQQLPNHTINVESVSTRVSVPTGQQVYVEVGSQEVSGSLYVPVTFAYSSGGRDFYVGNAITDFSVTGCPCSFPSPIYAIASTPQAGPAYVESFSIFGALT